MPTTARVDTPPLPPLYGPGLLPRTAPARPPTLASLDMSLPAHPDQLLEQAFERSLRLGDTRTAEQVAALMESRRGTHAVYGVMSRSLAKIGAEWQEGRLSILAERAASEASLAVCERLRARCPAPTTLGAVVLATPPGDRHTLALRALAHQLQAAGRPVQIVGELPVADLAEAASAEGVSALLLSAHVTMTVVSVRRLLGPLRLRAPQALLVLGGPGVPRGAESVADLVTDDAQAVVAALAAHDSVLTTREREVLEAVAEGLTTQEIAERLCLASSTVKTHLDHILTKTGTEHRAAAVARALREGWLS